jgi:hypothetical protein
MLVEVLQRWVGDSDERSQHTAGDRELQAAAPAGQTTP